MCKISHVRQGRTAGFSMIELVTVVGLVLILSAIMGPSVLTAIANIKIRYSAADLSGLMQKARIEAARKNTYYSILQTTLSSNLVGYYIDLNSNSSLDTGEPLAEMTNQITVHAGTSSGAPSETAFVSSFNFTVASSSVLPSFNARGLPCVVSGGTCPTIPGQGFIYFLSRTSTFGTNWASVAITPSGRVEVFSYDGNNWNQQ